MHEVEQHYILKVILLTVLNSSTIYAAAVIYSLPISVDIIGCHGDALSFKVQTIIINLSSEAWTTKQDKIWLQFYV